MKADALTPKDLFEGKVQFEIPSFQRPYVWTEEDQWAPLWADVKRVATKVIAADGDHDALNDAGAHFLGAVVIKELNHHAGDVARSAVIDGQQRMTTLQVLIDAAQAVIEDLGHEDEAEFLMDLILNPAKKFAGTQARFKLWPSRSDRDAFEYAMDHQGGPAHDEHRIAAAHRFFNEEIRSWLVDGADEGEPPVGDQEARVEALADCLQSRLYLVAINLGDRDDDQVIFETLNDRGTPLLAADLIKNWVFQTGEELHAKTEAWADDYWSEFDEDWWRKEISQGRHLRSRIDIFLQYWLTMRTKEEIPTEGVFRRFREYALELMGDTTSAEGLLTELKRDASTFRSFAELEPESSAGKFYSRVVESFELAATTPLLLWLLSDNHAVPGDQVDVGLAALESWVVRRTLLRMTMKDVNKLMVAMLAALDERPVEEAGDGVREFLEQQTADARVWPTDSEMAQDLPGIRLYGNVRQGRLRVVLEGIERQLRTEKNENTSFEERLEVEHIMPRGWRTHWNDDPPLDDVAAAERDKLVNTLGNLTLLTKKLNGSLSHRPWTDAESKPIGGKGKDAGLGKRSLITRYSLLVTNKQLVEEHPDSWPEQAIRSRGEELTERICGVWPRPEPAKQGGSGIVVPAAER